MEKLTEENENKEQKDKIEMKKIEVEKFVIPKKSDNIEQVYNIASLIINYEKESKNNIIIFSRSLVIQYIEFYNGNNLNNLLLINSLIFSIKGMNKEFEIKYEDKEISLIIHETGIELIKKAKNFDEILGLLPYIGTDIISLIIKVPIFLEL